METEQGRNDLPKSTGGNEKARRDFSNVFLCQDVGCCDLVEAQGLEYCGFLLSTRKFIWCFHDELNLSLKDFVGNNLPRTYDDLSLQDIETYLIPNNI